MRKMAEVVYCDLCGAQYLPKETKYLGMYYRESEYTIETNTRVVDSAGKQIDVCHTCTTNMIEGT